MPALETRDYRNVVEFRALDDSAFIVEGYATTFDEPYILYSWDGVNYFEKIDRHAFDDCVMNDVIMQYDHAGRVLARIKNGTLALTIDDHGLKVRADLSQSDAARSLYEDIKNGLVYQMSFGFTVADGGDDYDPATHTRTIYHIKRLYDVSAVSIPANPNTEIAVRSFINGVIEKEAEERRKHEEIERKRKILALMLEL